MQPSWYISSTREVVCLLIVWMANAVPYRHHQLYKGYRTSPVKHSLLLGSETCNVKARK